MTEIRNKKTNLIEVHSDWNIKKLDLWGSPLEFIKIRDKPRKGRTSVRGNRGSNMVEELRKSPEGKKREKSLYNDCAADTKGCPRGGQ